MKFPTIIRAGLAAFGVLLGGVLAQGQPVISGVFPDGTYKFQASSTLSFTASSSVGVTNVIVQLSATKLTGGSLIRNLSSSGGLTISGPATAELVSAPLSSNRVYSVTIQVTDGNGASTTTNLTFDTINGYTFEAEDFDYNNGQFIDNPQTNAYAGLTAVGGVDANNSNGGGQYRPVGTSGTPGGLATEDGANGGDTPPRVQYLNSGKTDYDIGFTDSGDWGNYTRHYPAGVYNVYMRAANPNGPGTDSASLSVVAGNASLSASPATFAVPTTGGWQIYQYIPLMDANNNLVQLTIPDEGGGKSLNTIRATTDPSASYNANFYLLVPQDPTPVPGEAVITNIYPDGSIQFQQTNQFVFSILSTNGINPSDITVQLSGTNLTGATTSQLLTSGGGLTVAGVSTNLTVSTALTTNTTYGVFIQIIDSFGNVTTTNFLFDTISPNYYTFEARDTDIGGGQFIDNPQTNAYISQDGIIDVDFYDSAGGYITYSRFGLPAENCNDVPRPPYINSGFNDYDVGNTHSGDWGNYSRTYPAGTYNIYMRAASANSGTTADSASLGIVNPTQPTDENQTVSKLGTFSVPGTGGWQKYVWVLLKNSAGYPARFNVGSTPTVHTLRATTDSGGYNSHFYLLVPADPNATFPPFVSDFHPDGSTLFQYTNKLTFTANSAVGISTNNISLSIDGGAVSGLTFSGSSSAWVVSFPVGPNGFHTAVVKLTDSIGTTYFTNKFDTFDPATFTFDAEDYDYNGGQFIDNSIGAYAGFSGVLDVDDHWDYNVGNSYRVSSVAGEGLSIESPSGDTVRPNYSGYDFDVGHNDGGNWANYTRTYPPGDYNIWIRYASPNGSPNIADAAKISLITGGWGTTSQTFTNLGTFTVHNTGGWGNYNTGWAPLIDANGNYVKWTSSGSTNTLRYTIDSGGFNVDFFALVPADTSRPTIANLYPNGLSQFEQTNQLSFDAISSSGIDTNSIVVSLNGVAVSGVTFTGSSTDWHVTVPVSANMLYAVNISFSTLLGGAYSTSYTFDTYAPSNYQWEAEDWDYTSNGVSGLFVDGKVDAYAGLDATEGIDVFQSNSNTLLNPYDYRAYDNVNLTPAQEPSGDLARPQFGTNTDYKVDWFGYGSWLNYTHHYPAGTYYVVGRFTEGSAATVATLGKVTAGAGTINQTVSTLGTFFIPLGSWSSSESVYLTDNNSNLVTVTFDGSPTTLRFSGNPVALNDPTINANYFMLVPATAPSGPLNLTASVSGGNIVISFATLNNKSYAVLYKDTLDGGTWISTGTTITGNGSVQSASFAASGSQRFYRVQIQ